ncbi:hypothetical protein [Amycolatopsis samaneae]|uniref:Uncharacterized protein n=1 Tax=Amycolatopsis samaneae TaxID=664691 RepID=A0ABW5GSR3_9PSEU
MIRTIVGCAAAVALPVVAGVVVFAPAEAAGNRAAVDAPVPVAGKFVPGQLGAAPPVVTEVSHPGVHVDTQWPGAQG